MAYTLLFQSYKKEEISAQELRDHWLGQHSEIAATVPGLIDYQIFITVSSKDAYEPAPDGYVLMRFESKEAAETALNSPEWKATNADAGPFWKHYSTFEVETHTMV